MVIALQREDNQNYYRMRQREEPQECKEEAESSEQASEVQEDTIAPRHGLVIKTKRLIQEGRNDADTVEAEE